MTRRRAAALAALFLPLVSLLPACGARLARVPVHEQGGVEVLLRGPADPDHEDAPAHDHPAVIAGVRIAHVLSRLDVEPSGDDGRRPAVATELVYPVAEGIAAALEQARPHQEVVVRAVRRERRFGIFTHRYLTGLLAWVDAGQLHLHFSDIDWEIPRGPDVRLPEPRLDRTASGFRLLPSQAVTPLGAFAVRVDWRDSVFATPTALTVSPLGRTERRTILLESEGGAGGEGGAGDPGAAAGPAPEPGSLAPETLRALADLEQARCRGELSEADYQARRREILLRDPGGS